MTELNHHHGWPSPLFDGRARPMPAIIERAAVKLGAYPADIPGLWFAPGFPELTTGQLIQIAAELS